jgi:hypothetical protein
MVEAELDTMIRRRDARRRERELWGRGREVSYDFLCWY